MIRKKIRVRKISNVRKYIVMIFLSLMALTLTVSFGRYVYTKVLDLYFLTKKFYFESDKLKNPAASYSLNYWNGVDPYRIVVTVKSFKNDILRSATDVTYTTRYSCPNNVICTLSKQSGTIDKDVGTDSFVFIMTPDDTFNDNDSVTVTVFADSTGPYTKTLSATFTLTVGKYGLGHEIEDSAGSPYLNLKVTNTLDSYLVKENITDHDADTHISKAIYDALSPADKAKCASAIITVAFNPTVVKVDNTATDFMHAYDIETQVINSYDYVKKFKFDMDSSVSSVIKFYKTNKSVDYSNSNVLTVTYRY